MYTCMYICIGAEPVTTTPAPTPQGDSSSTVVCNLTSPDATYPSCGSVKGCDSQNNPLSITTAANVSLCITSCTATSTCKACTYDKSSSQCILLKELTSVTPGAGNWSTYICQTLSRVYDVTTSCPQVGGGTGRQRRQMLPHSLQWLSISQERYPPHHQEEDAAYPHHPRRLQSYTNGCPNADPSNVTSISLVFITPNGSSTVESLLAWNLLVSDLSSGGSPAGYNSSTICSINTNTSITYQTGSPTPAPTPSPTNGPTISPSAAPTSLPTTSPSKVPTSIPTSMPTFAPSEVPTSM